MIVERDAVRAVLLTPEREVLLMRIRPPDGGSPFWITPGGGTMPGEGTEACLRRELREELGLEAFELGPLLWRRQHTFNWTGRRLLQRERYHAVHVDRFEPLMSDAHEARVLDRFRWWTLEELARASERLTPLTLAQIVTTYLTSGPPSEPLDLEVCVD